MKREALIAFSLVLGISGLAFAQAKTVTNEDLEKFKQKRLQAEKELRENYKELGFPSPDEIARQNAQSRKERAELSQRLREQRLAREALKVQNGADVTYSDSDDYQADFIDYQQYYGATYYAPYYRSTNRRFRNNRGFKKNNRGRRNNRIRLNGNEFRYRGFIGGTTRNRRNSSFGPSRRLTRQNRVKSRRANRAFKRSLFYGTRQN